MAKFITNAFLGLLLSANVIACNLSDRDHQEFSPAQVNDGPSLLTLPSDVLVEVSKHLDLQCAGRFMRSCKAINNRSEAIYKYQIPKAYDALGHDCNQVFIQLDHPKWTPGALPKNVWLKMHSWFFKGVRLSKSEEPDDILNAYYLFLSAGSFGNMHALERAGRMIANKSYNDIIPMIPVEERLQPEMEAWDARRLNEEITDNPLLLEIREMSLATFRSYYKWRCDKDDCETSTRRRKLFNEQVALVLKGLGIIGECPEVDAAKILFEEFRAYVEQNDDEDDFFPSKTLAFARTLPEVPPFIYFLIQELNDDEEWSFSEESLQLSIYNFSKTLNHEFAYNYQDVFRQKMNRDYEAASGGFPICTSQAREAARRHIDLDLIQILLGDLNPSFRHMRKMEDYFDSELEVNEKKNAKLEYIEKEQFIRIGLCYLILARDSTGYMNCSKYDVITDLNILLAGQEYTYQAPENTVNWPRLYEFKKKYNAYLKKLSGLPTEDEFDEH